MGQTKKSNYGLYALAFKLQAVMLAEMPSVTAMEVADRLGIHVAMLYRGRMEKRKEVRLVLA